MDNKKSLELSKLDYPGELTLEALSVLDTYTKQCCNTAATARKLHKNYIRIRHYLHQPYVRELFQLQLIRKGVTPEKIAEVINQGLGACDKDNQPDWFARKQFTQLACEIYEVLKYPIKIDQHNVSVTQLFSADEQVEYERIRQGLHVKLSSIEITC